MAAIFSISSSAKTATRAKSGAVNWAARVPSVSSRQARTPCTRPALSSLRGVPPCLHKRSTRKHDASAVRRWSSASVSACTARRARPVWEPSRCRRPARSQPRTSCRLRSVFRGSTGKDKGLMARRQPVPTPCSISPPMEIALPSSGSIRESIFPMW